MVTELNKLTNPIERSQYILMDRVQAPLVKNYIVNVISEEALLEDTVAELGIFGVFIR